MHFYIEIIKFMAGFGTENTITVSSYLKTHLLSSFTKTFELNLML